MIQSATQTTAAIHSVENSPTLVSRASEPSHTFERGAEKTGFRPRIAHHVALPRPTVVYVQPSGVASLPPAAFNISADTQVHSMLEQTFARFDKAAAAVPFNSTTFHRVITLLKNQAEHADTQAAFAAILMTKLLQRIQKHPERYTEGVIRKPGEATLFKTLDAKLALLKPVAGDADEPAIDTLISALKHVVREFLNPYAEKLEEVLTQNIEATQNSVETLKAVYQNAGVPEVFVDALVNQCLPWFVDVAQQEKKTRMSIQNIAIAVQQSFLPVSNFGILKTSNRLLADAITYVKESQTYLGFTRRDGVRKHQVKG